jgi:hypothetical protein
MHKHCVSHQATVGRIYGVWWTSVLNDFDYQVRKAV